ncbi:MAG: transposase [Candidatus Nanoarchaeia archaeon]
MTLGLSTLLFSTLSTAAEQNEYLEGVSQHADAIGWHLNKVKSLDFIASLQEFFVLHLKDLKRRKSMNFLTVAFDETYISYYGKRTDSVWIHGYKNKVKGATGSYKFMVVSIVLRNERYVLGLLPMATTDSTIDCVEEMLALIKKQFNVSLVLLDGGFASKELVRSMDEQQQKYIALCPKWKNVKKFLEKGIVGICEIKKIRKHRREIPVKVQYVIEYNLLEHDWVFLTNTDLRGMDLVRAYKARWGIETTFRVMDHADIKSKSTNIVTRTFFFLISTLLYNMWIEEREKLGCTFTKYLDWIVLAQKNKEQLISEWKEAKMKLESFMISEKNIQTAII